jgi:RNA ligase (TIGR02306 family)
MLEMVKNLFKSVPSSYQENLIPSGNPEVVEVAEEESGSGYKVPYTKILDIQPHNNAERLEVATIYGFQVITQKGKYKIGDKVIYIPIDSVLNPDLEDLLIPPDSKIKLHHHRVRQIKIRGLASQGMIVDPQTVKSIVNPDYFSDEQDLRKILNVTKYEPPVKEARVNTGMPKSRNAKNPHPLFHRYNGLGNIKWFPNMFKEGQQVVIQEKLHGTNARAALLPFRPTTLMKRIKLLLRIAPKVEQCYGSNLVDKSAVKGPGFYSEDVWGNVFKKLDVFNKLKLGESVFGEIVGPGIQKGYSYGLTEHKFILFDVKRILPDGTQEWLTPDDVEAFAKERGFEYVPVLYKGPFNKDMAYHLTKGASMFNDKSEKVREGIAIKAAQNYSIEGNKQALKWVSEDYLADHTNTDEH